MVDRRKIEDFHDALWIAGPRARSSSELPQGREIAPDRAARELDEWFPEGPGEAARTDLLFDLCEELGEVPGRGVEPPTLRRLKARVADALARGALVALRIKATTPDARRLETELPGEEKPPEQVTHWVEFEVKDQNDNPISGIPYVLTLVGAGPENGTLGKDGTVYRTGVKKGTHRLDLKTITKARWEKSDLREGEAVKLFAKVTGFPEAQKGEFQIHDATGLTDAAVVSAIAGKVEMGIGAVLSLTAEWTPKAKDLAAVKSGRLTFIAKVDGFASTATSAEARVLLKHEIDVQDQDGPIQDDTDIVARFSGGTRETKKTLGGKAEVWAPAGEALTWVLVAGRPGARATFKAEGPEVKYLAPEHVKG